MKRLVIIAVLLLFVSVPYVAAHPYTMETNPNSTVNAAIGITKVHVIYSEQIELDFSSLKIFDSNGNQIDNKDTQYYKDEKSLTVSTPPLQEGIYTVASKVLSRVDGHLVPDAFVFAVGDIKLNSQDLVDRQIKDVIFLPEAGSRFLGLVGQTVVLGAVIASLLIWGTQNKQLIRDEMGKLDSIYHGRFMSITGVGLVLVVISNIAILAIQAWRLESHVLDVIQTAFGTTWIMRMAITIILFGIWFWMDRKRQLTKINQIPLLVFSLVLIGTTTMMGHGAASGEVFATLLDYIHNLVAAIWIGGIIFFVFALLPTFSSLDNTKKEMMSLVMIPRFSIAFVIAVGIVIITGPTLMWFLESDVSIIVESTYGKLIMTKIAIATIMVGFGGFFQFKILNSIQKETKSKSFSIYRKMKRSLKVDASLGVILLGVVALLANGTLPAGEIQKVDAQENLYKFTTTEFSEDAKFDVEIVPFASGNNSVFVRVSDLDGNQIYDLSEVNIKVSNPHKGISPIEITTQRIDGSDQLQEFDGEVTFGFADVWQVEIEAQRTDNANESVLMNLFVKPRLADIKTEIIEYDLPDDAKPLYPLFDGNNSIWISDPSAPRLWKFELDSSRFESFSFDGLTSGLLTQDNEGKIWFTDSPANQIGFIEPASNEITKLSLPELQPVIHKNILAFIQSDLEGNIWVAVTNKDLLLKYDQQQKSFEEIKLPDERSLPFALAVDDKGKIWFTGSATGKIGYINPENNEVVEFAPEEPLVSPEYLLFDDDGMVWISEHGGAKIVKFDPVFEVFERIPVQDDKASPFGMSFDRFGNIWIAQHTVDSMAVYDPDNDTMVDIPIPTATSFVQFTTTDDKGNVWFVEQQGNKLAMANSVEISHVISSNQERQIDLKYTEIASPLIAIGIVATALFYVKGIKDKRRLNDLISSQ